MFLKIKNMKNFYDRLLEAKKIKITIKFCYVRYYESKTKLKNRRYEEHLWIFQSKINIMLYEQPIDPNCTAKSIGRKDFNFFSRNMVDLVVNK